MAAKQRRISSSSLFVRLSAWPRSKHQLTPTTFGGNVAKTSAYLGGEKRDDAAVATIV